MYICNIEIVKLCVNEYLFIKWIPLSQIYERSIFSLHTMFFIITWALLSCLCGLPHFVDNCSIWKIGLYTHGMHLRDAPMGYTYGIWQWDASHGICRMTNNVSEMTGWRSAGNDGMEVRWKRHGVLFELFIYCTVCQNYHKMLKYRAISENT